MHDHGTKAYHLQQVQGGPLCHDITVLLIGWSVSEFIPGEGTALGVEVFRQTLLASLQLLAQHAQGVQSAIHAACLQNVGVLGCVLHDLLPRLVDAIKPLGFLHEHQAGMSHVPDASWPLARNLLIIIVNYEHQAGMPPSHL